MIPPHSALTLAIIKPDIASVPYILSSIHKRILASEFLVLRSKNLKFSPGLAQDFYQEHHGKFFYNRLVTFMSSGPSCVSVLAHPKGDAIGKWRELMGPTKVLKTKFESPDSIRGSFGLTDTRNGVHGSDSPENARKEILFFFPDFEFEKAAQMIEKRKELRLDVESFVHYLPS